MKIDGTDIRDLISEKIEFLDYTPAGPSLSRAVTVSDGDHKIVNRRETVGIMNLQVRLAMYDTKENCLIMASHLTSYLGEAYVDFDGELIYRVTTSSQGTLELKTTTLFVYSFELQVLEKMGQPVEINTTSAAPIALPNIGSLKTPIIIEVTPTASIPSFSVFGFGAHTAASPLVYSSPTVNKKTILDGVDCRIMQEGVSDYTDTFASTNLISFPYVIKGGSTLTFSPTNLNITIKYNPRYI